MKTILHLSTNSALSLTREKVLTDAGYSVLSTDSDKIAVTLAQLRPFDAVILCSSIAPLSGNRVAAAVRLRNKKIPVIGFGDQHSRFADISVNQSRTAKWWLRTLADVLSLNEDLTPPLGEIPSPTRERRRRVNWAAVPSPLPETYGSV